MMKLLCKYKGVWCFILAVGWFVASCFINEYLDDKHQSIANNTNKKQEHFDINNITAVKVQSASKCDDYSCFNYEGISLIFDPTLDTITTNTENLGLTVKGTKQDGKFVLTVEKVPKRHYEYGKKLTIRIPTSVHKLEVDNIATVEVTGSFSAPEDALSLIILGDETIINIYKFKIAKLMLYALHEPAAKKCECKARFNIGDDAEIVNLEATMSHGFLDFSAKQMPALSVLTLSDNVKISGHKSFFQNAQLRNFIISEPK